MGMVHGRFQPFHIEQLQYILSGLAKCDFLTIGITNPDPTEFKFESRSNHRHLSDANPFSFYQRAHMINESLIDIKIDLNRITITPFHLFDSTKWKYYLPSVKSTVQFVRIFSPWEQKKVKLFEDYGFKVVIIDQGIKKNIEATEVRRRMKNGEDWKALVPNGTARVIEKINNALI